MAQIKKVLDAASLPDFGRAACDDGERVIAWHVTDNPSKIASLIRSRANFVKAYGNVRSELGPGLYVSCIPEFWAARSTKKWSFIGKLTVEEKASVAGALMAGVESAYLRGRLTESEKNFAFRILNNPPNSLDLESAVMLAGQPYGIRWWEDSWLKEIGLTNEPPKAVKVAIHGRFAELTASYPDPEVLRQARKMRLQGVFTRAGMSTNAEMCVFSGKSLEFLGVERV